MRIDTEGEEESEDEENKAEVKVPVLLVALVYIDRAKPHLQIALEQWACERVFLGALIVANKVRSSVLPYTIDADHLVHTFSTPTIQH